MGKVFGEKKGYWERQRVCKAESWGLILSQPSADSSLCGGSLLGKASADAGFRLCGGEAVDGARLAAFRSPPPPLRTPLISGYHIQHWQVAAALSAAVTATTPQETAPHSQAEPLMKKGTSQTPAALRERGSGGEALLSEKRPLPQHLPTVTSSGGSAREGASLQRSPLPRIPIPSVLGKFVPD